MMGSINLQRRQRRWRGKINMKTSTTTKTDALAEDRRPIQGIEDNDGCGSGSKTDPVDWQKQLTVDFPYFPVVNSNTSLSLSSCYLVLILFLSDVFFCSLQKIISVLQSCGKYFVPNVH